MSRKESTEALYQVLAKKPYAELNVEDLRAHLAHHKELIDLTSAKADGNESAGSDSEPSEDNLEEDEMAKLVPIKPKKKKQSDLNKRR